jgi:hypothetical protein
VNPGLRAFAHSVLLVALVAHQTLVEAQTGGTSDAARGMTYASLAQLPDFSGWWYWQLPESGPPYPFMGAPFKPEVVEALQQFLAQLGTDVDINAGPSTYCRPPRFFGYNGGFTEAVEFLFTPGRVTITNESGLIRRVDLDDKELPANPVATNVGTSVGRWEGNTLVVETRGIKGGARFFWGSDVGTGVRVLERMTLKGPDTLEIRMHVTAPDALTAPFENTLLYRRDDDHAFAEGTSCAEDDRSVDVKTGQQRFDMTPPPDLPPPPVAQPSSTAPFRETVPP